MALVGRPKGTGSQRIGDVLRRRNSFSLRLMPGSIIDENAVAEEFSISRTPVREAIIRLATDGYVNLTPNRGATVSPLDISELPILLEAAELCFRASSRWAALRRSDADLDKMKRHQEALKLATRKLDYLAMSDANSQFHEAVAVAGGNRHLVALFRSILPQYHRLSVAMLASASRWARQPAAYFSGIYDEHHALIDAIRNHDSNAADRIAQDHSRLTGGRLEGFIWGGLDNPIELSDSPDRLSFLASPPPKRGKRRAK